MTVAARATAEKEVAFDGGPVPDTSRHRDQNGALLGSADRNASAMGAKCPWTRLLGRHSAAVSKMGTALAMDDHLYFKARAAQHRAEASKAEIRENRLLHQRFAQIYERRAAAALVEED